MDLSNSYETAVPADVLARYDWRETRNAASIIRHTNPDEFDDFLEVLRAFTLDEARDILVAGKNESLTAKWLNHAFRARGWREATYQVQLRAELILRPYRLAGELKSQSQVSEVVTSSYLVDNVKGRVALDVEWQAKDGNLDRDIAAYRSLYDAGIIDAALIVTMTRADLRAMVLDADPASKKFGTSTTTNVEMATPRLQRGDGGGCPLLIAAICARTT